MQAQIVNKIFEIFSKNNPNPKTELIYKNDFTLLVAVILSAQATDISVNLATKSLFEAYDTPEKILELGEEGFKKNIKSIGLFNSKAKNIIALFKILISNYQASVPNDFKELVKLPGVGRKTANVVLNCLFGMPTMAVDTHVFRVAKRIGLAKGSTPEIVEKELLQIINEKWLTHAHHWLILHGKYICKARKPDCDICPIKEYCEYYINKLIVNEIGIPTKINFKKSKECIRQGAECNLICEYHSSYRTTTPIFEVHRVYIFKLTISCLIHNI